MSNGISFGTPSTPAGLITTDARVKLWNTETWEYQSGTTGTGVGGLVSVENFPAVISGANIPISDALNDPTKHYKITDLDTAGTTKYFGYVDKDGNWYIMKLTDTQGRYIKGVSDYINNWINRATLSYDYFNVVF